MGKLEKALTPLERATLMHCRLGHASLRIMYETDLVTMGGLTLTPEGMKELAAQGCAWCNLFKLQLMNPKKQTKPRKKQLIHIPVDQPATQKIRTFVYDQKGPWPIPSAGEGYFYAHLFIDATVQGVGKDSGTRTLYLFGSKRIRGEDIRFVMNQWYALMRSIGIDPAIIRLDCLPAHKGDVVMGWINKMLLHNQWSPPGQHAHIGIVERYWYVLCTNMLIAIQQRSAPKAAWFDALLHMTDVENVKRGRLQQEHPSCGYDAVPTASRDISDLHAFYARGSFMLDKGQTQGMFTAPGAVGVWVGRDRDYVLKGHKGSSVWWDGHKHRTVVNNFYIQEKEFTCVNEITSTPTADKVDATNKEWVRDVDTFLHNRNHPESPPQPDEPALTIEDDLDNVDIQSETTDPDEEESHQLTRPNRTCNKTQRYEPDGGTTMYSLVSEWRDQLHGSSLPEPLPAPCISLPCQNIVINLCSGPYDNKEGVSTKLRSKGVGVINVDNDPEYGGGYYADINVDYIFRLLCDLVEARRIAGIVAQVPCGTGSVARLRKLLNATKSPAQLRTAMFPNGVPDMDPSDKKVMHQSELLTWRAACLCIRVHELGGWFLSEGSAVRDNENHPQSHDPAFASHASVLSDSATIEMIKVTGATVVTPAMCALKDDYPQKLLNIILSPRVPTHLAATLHSSQCRHEKGTHKNAFTGAEYGGLPVSQSQTWIEPLCVSLMQLPRSAPREDPT